MSKPLGRARLIDGGAYSIKGAVVNVYEYDLNNRIYYYDDMRRWCYANPGEYVWVSKSPELKKLLKISD